MSQMSQVSHVRSPAFPRVVVLCGSTRFKEEFIEATARETLAGKIVLSVGSFDHADGIELTEAQKEALGELHLRKIDLADEVLVINPGRYIDESTAREVNYAMAHNKPIRFLEREDQP